MRVQLDAFKAFPGELGDLPWNVFAVRMDTAQRQKTLFLPSGVFFIDLRGKPKDRIVLMRGSDYGKNDAYVDSAAFHRRPEPGCGTVRGRSDPAGDSQLMKSLGGYFFGE